jgi:hypothetical protein
MKPLTITASVIAAVLVIGLAGCKKEAKVDATKPLEQSFQAASPEVKATIQAANKSLQAGNYGAATEALLPAVNGQQLTEPQRQALALSLKQINQAIAANPGLDSADLSRKRRQIFDRIYRGD